MLCFFALFWFLCKTLATLFFIYIWSPFWYLPPVNKLTDDQWKGASFGVFFTYFYALSPWFPSHFFLPLLLVTFLVCMSICLNGWWCQSDFWVDLEFRSVIWDCTFWNKENALLQFNVSSEICDLVSNNGWKYSQCYRWRIWNKWSSLSLCWPKVRLIHIVVGLSSIERDLEGDYTNISQVGFMKVKTHGTKNTWVCFIGEHNASFWLRFTRETNCISYTKLSQIPRGLTISSRKAGLLTCSTNQHQDDNFAFKKSSKN